MPLPPDSFTVHGGCNSQAVRYAIHVPSQAERIPFPPPPENKVVELPHIVICRCNDCRSAVGNLTLAGFCCQIDIVEVSALKRASSSRTPSFTEAAKDNLPASGKVNIADTDPRREWLPAQKMFPLESPPLDSFLAVYHSSAKAARTFCTRCGCGLTYTFMGPREPLMLDVYLGTVDREDLDKYVLRPDRHVWWDHGIEWVRELYKSGAQGGLPKHAITNLREVVQNGEEKVGHAKDIVESTSLNA